MAWQLNTIIYNVQMNNLKNYIYYDTIHWGELSTLARVMHASITIRVKCQLLMYHTVPVEWSPKSDSDLSDELILGADVPSSKSLSPACVRVCMIDT